MRVLFLLSGCFVGCGADLESIHLTKEYYKWECVEKTQDYPVDKVVVTTETCDSEVTWIIAELYYKTGQTMKQRMYKELGGCGWENEFPLINADCADVDGVTATVWYDNSFGGSND